MIAVGQEQGATSVTPSGTLCSEHRAGNTYQLLQQRALEGAWWYNEVHSKVFRRPLKTAHCPPSPVSPHPPLLAQFPRTLQLSPAE